MKVPKIKFSYKLAFWVVVAVLFLFIVAFVVVPLGCGYTIGFLNGYQWQASNVIGLLGVVGSLAAVGVAIWVPSKVATQQNKIALYDKRLTLYNDIKKLCEVSHMQILLANMTHGDRLEERLTAYQSYILLFYRMLKLNYPNQFTFDIKMVTEHSIAVLEECYIADFIMFLNIISAKRIEINLLFDESVGTAIGKIVDYGITPLSISLNKELNSVEYHTFQDMIHQFELSELKEVERILNISKST